MDLNSPLLITLLTLGAGGTGALVMNLWNARLKKVEVNFELYQQSKIDAVGRYYDAYAKIYLWCANKLFEIRQGEECVFEEIDHVTATMLEDIKSCTDRLNMFFPQEEHRLFVEVHDVCFTLCRTIRHQHYLKYKGKQDVLEIDMKQMGICQQYVETGMKKIGSFVQAHFAGKKRPLNSFQDRR